MCGVKQELVDLLHVKLEVPNEPLLAELLKVSVLHAVVCLDYRSQLGGSFCGDFLVMGSQM